MKQKKNYQIDMCNGPLMGKMLLFFFPLMLSSMLQLLFNAVDVIVVGRYAGNEALAAVGSTSALINLLTNLFIGLSIGTNVMVARYFGANQKKDLAEMVQTSICAALFSGMILLGIGYFFSKPALQLMGTPDDVINLSVKYMKIYFMGMPFTMVYNFGSAVLRAVGDTRRPLIYLSISGVINLCLNLYFVISLNMGVAGVALATIIAQGLSAILVVICLIREDADYKLVLNQNLIRFDKIGKILQIGLPAGVQGILFSFSNVLIQSSINSFGSVAMAGNTAAANIEGFVYMAMNAWHQTALSFTGQNYGGHQFDRIKKICALCLLSVTITGLIFGNGVVLLNKPLLGLYTTDPEVLSFGKLRMIYICCGYFLCGIMDVMVGVLRGMGYSIMPMLVSLTGACLFRIIWISTIFQMYHSLPILYLSYPISWILTFTVHFICYTICIKKKRNQQFM